ncbi:hypothetical protein BS78_07G043500 [Paspalum vaginatum]|nr:hypothetical protein BS78_07G043500 [Paspalum vaginatum]
MQSFVGRAASYHSSLRISGCLVWCMMQYRSRSPFVSRCRAEDAKQEADAVPNPQQASLPPTGQGLKRRQPLSSPPCASCLFRLHQQVAGRQAQALALLASSTPAAAQLLADLIRSELETAAPLLVVHPHDAQRAVADCSMKCHHRQHCPPHIHGAVVGRPTPWVTALAPS